MAYFEELREHAPPAQTERLTVIAQDPSIRAGRRILTARVAVPAEVTEPGPRGARFHVVDYDASAGKLMPPVPLSRSSAVIGAKRCSVRRGANGAPGGLPLA